MSAPITQDVLTIPRKLPAADKTNIVGLTRAALRERYYSAVMAATGLLYLAILTAFGTDLVARAVLAS